MVDQPETILNNVQETPESSEVTKVSEDNSELTDLKSQLTSIVNQDGKQKYSTVQEALKAIPFATEHISKLEQENSKLTEELTKAQTVKDILDEISVQRTPTEQQTVQGLDESRVAEIVTAQLTATEQQKLVKTNQELAATALQKHFGDVKAAEKEYINKAQELGVSIQFLNDVAAKSPKALLDLFNVNVSKQQEVPEKIQGSGNAPVSVEEKPKPKSVMFGASHHDLVNAWRAAAPEQD